MPPGRTERALVFVFTALFVWYALNFLYFFVDDEAISFVYAQRLLAGRGLSYSDVEGPVEGYSNFLNVWLNVVILTVIGWAGAGKLWAFGIGKALSLGFATAIVYATGMRLLRLEAVRRTGLVTGLAFLSLAGPLAVWACSSLETTFFALVFATLVWTVVFDARQPIARAALLAAVLVLTRSDGFVYAGAALGTAALMNSARRREILLKVALPAAGVLGAYRLWCVWYFGDLLPLPLYAKVLFKLTDSEHLVVLMPSVGYLRRFLNLYAWTPLIPLALVGAMPGADRRGRSVAIITAALMTYLWVVSDWMFGFRFFVPLLPLFALLFALGVSTVENRWPTAGRAMAVLLVVSFVVVAYRFERLYEGQEDRRSWWRAPGVDAGRFFWPYFALYEETAGLLEPGDTVAYNQAGFLSFMRDLNNIDDLGICNRFCAKLPTRDVIFTEVGRYSPLTRRRAVRASEAYLLYHEPKAVIARIDNLLSANQQQIPEDILSGAYRRAFVDSARQNVVYVRSERPVDAFKREPHRFLENVAHVARLRSAHLNGVAVRPGSYQREFRYLFGGYTLVNREGPYAADFDFGEQNIDVYEVHIESIRSSVPATLTLILQSAANETVYQGSFPVTPDAHDVRVFLPKPVSASRFCLRVSGEAGQAGRLGIVDLRVQGQTPELGRYVREHLQFQGQ